jgi:hypothetical protein
VAVWPVTEFAVARNVADVAPEATVTLAGTVTAVLLLESVTTAFPEAALLMMTMQFDEAPLAMLVGLQLKEVTCAGALAVNEVDTATLLPET